MELYPRAKSSALKQKFLGVALAQDPDDPLRGESRLLRRLSRSKRTLPQSGGDAETQVTIRELKSRAKRRGRIDH